MAKLLFYILFFVSTASLCQAQFISQGKITYERKTNLRQQMQTEEDGEWVKSMINKIAQHTISEFSMSFDKATSEYEFVKEQEVNGMTFSWGKKPASENKVFTDFTTGKVKAQKEVYENNYLVEGDIKKYSWKIESDMRMIAGYPCRKAITRICDSVVVVAFYTDQIMVSGGPEGFNGLPGMILGVAVPRLYTTWFATNVEMIPQEVKPFTPAKKSKKVTEAQLMEDIHQSTKKWGKYGAKLLWWLTL